jgi:hypothetical protein
VANALVVVFVTVAVTGLMDPIAGYYTYTFLWVYAGITVNLPRIARSQEKARPLRLGAC